MSHPVDPAAAAAAEAARWQGAPSQAVVATPPPPPTAGVAWWEPRTFKVRLPAGAARGLVFVLWLLLGLKALGYDPDAHNAETLATVWLSGFTVLAVVEAVMRLRLGGHITIDPGQRLVHWRRPRDFGPTRSWSFDEVTSVHVGAIQEQVRLRIGRLRFKLDPEPTATAAVAALSADVAHRAAHAGTRRLPPD